MVANSLGAAGIAKKPQTQGPPDPNKQPVKEPHVRAILRLANGGSSIPPQTTPKPPVNPFAKPAQKTFGNVPLLDLNKNPYDIPLPGAEEMKGPVTLRLELPVSGAIVDVPFDRTPTMQELADLGDEIDNIEAWKVGRVHPIRLDKIQALKFDPVELYLASINKKPYVKMKGGTEVLSKQQAQQQLAKILEIADYRQLNNLQGPEFKKLRLIVDDGGWTPDSQEADMRDAGISNRDKGIIKRNPGIGNYTDTDLIAKSIGTWLSPSELQLLQSNDARSFEEIDKNKVNFMGMEISEGGVRAGLDVLGTVAGAALTGGASALVRGGLAAAGKIAAKETIKRSLAREIVQAAAVNAGTNIAQMVPGTITGARDIEATTGKKYGQALRESAGQQIEGLVRQFNPVTIFDTSLPPGERVGAALNLLLLGAAGSTQVPKGVVKRGSISDMLAGAGLADYQMSEPGRINRAAVDASRDANVPFSMRPSRLAENWEQVAKNPENARKAAKANLERIITADETEAGGITPETQALREQVALLDSPEGLQAVQQAADVAMRKVGGLLPDPTPGSEVGIGKMVRQEPNKPELVDAYGRESQAIEQAIIGKPEWFDSKSDQYRPDAVEAAFRYTEGRAPETPDELTAYASSDLPGIRETLGDLASNRDMMLGRTLPQVKELGSTVWKMLKGGKDTPSMELPRAGKNSKTRYRFVSVAGLDAQTQEAVLRFAKQVDGDSDIRYTVDGLGEVTPMQLMELESGPLVSAKALDRMARELTARQREMKAYAARGAGEITDADMEAAVSRLAGKTEPVAKINKETKESGQVLAPERTSVKPKSNIAKMIAGNVEEVTPPSATKTGSKRHITKLLAADVEVVERTVAGPDGQPVTKQVAIKLGENAKQAREAASREMAEGLAKAKATRNFKAINKKRKSEGKPELSADERQELAKESVDLEREAQAAYHRARLAAVEMDGNVDVTNGVPNEPKQGSAQTKAMVEKQRAAMIEQGRKEGRRTEFETTAHTSAKDPAGGSEYGGQNRVVTKERYEQLVAERRKGGMGGNRQRGAANMSPKDIADMVEFGVYHFEAGIRSFKPWLKQVKASLGADYGGEVDNRAKAVHADIVEKSKAQQARDTKGRSRRKLTEKHNPTRWRKGADRWETFKNAFEYLYADTTAEARRAVEQLASAQGKKFEDYKGERLDIHTQINRATRVDALVQLQVLDGVVNSDGKKIAPGVNDLIEALKAEKIEPDEYEDYRYALRRLELTSRLTEDAPVKPTAIQLEQWDDTVSAFLANHDPEAIDRLHEITTKMFDAQLLLRERYGMELPGYADRIREENPHYWPLKEIKSENELLMNALNPESMVGSSDKTIRAVGQDVDYMDGFSAYAVNLERTIREGMKNEAYMPFMMEASGEPLMDSLVRIATAEDILAFQSGDDKSVVKLWEQGQAIYFKVDPYLWAAMRSVDPQVFTGYKKALQLMSRIFKGGTTTANPIFRAFHNPILDVGSAMANHGLKPEFAIKGMQEVAKRTDSDLYRQWIADMGSGNGKKMRDFEIQQELYADGLKHPELNKASNELLGMVEKGKEYWEKFENLTNIPEEGVRMGMYLQALSEGKSRSQASQIGADVMNFGRSGEIGRVLSEFGVPYSAIPGQAFYQMREGFRRDPKKWMMRVGVILPMLKLAESIAYENDEDYQNLPEYQKDKGLLFKLPTGGFLNLPIDNAIGAVFLAAPRRMFQFFKGKQGGIDAVGGQVKAMSDSYVPAGVPIPIKSLLEFRTFSQSGAVIDSTFGNIQSYPQDLSKAKDETVRKAQYRLFKQQVGNFTGSLGRDSVKAVGYFLGAEENFPYPWQRYTPAPRDVRDEEKRRKSGGKGGHVTNMLSDRKQSLAERLKKYD
jgi:hypothetical protein